MATYSFLNISCLMVGPGIASNLASGAGASEEGITVEATTDKNIMTIGADGTGQHSLVADDSCSLTIRLLKTSPLNAALMIAYDLQTVSSALHGINTFTLSDTARGDFTVIQQAAFKKRPTLTYAKEGGMMEWTFDGIQVNSILGGGI
jgi:Protein of unknown function (DUF3277)